MKAKIDSIGDRWIFCKKHNEWWLEYGGFCSGCYPKLELWTKINASIFALIIMGLFFGFLFYYLWMGMRVG